MARWIARHSRAHVVGYVALFLVLSTGTAWAALKPNSVRSKQIANGQVKARDIGNGAVGSRAVKDNSLTGKDINEATLDANVLQRRIATGCATGQAMRAVAADGAVTCDPFPSFSIADGSITASKLALPLSLTGTRATPFVSISGDNNASLGAEPSDSMLSVVQPGVNTTGPTIYGETGSQFSNFGTAALMGVNSGTGGFGIFGWAKNPSGNGPAMVAISDGNGNGLTANSQNDDGVEATTDSTTATDAGVYGWAPSFTSATGVKAAAFGAGGTALRATAGGSATQAAIFTGNVSVNGTLSKSAGSFKIDDPIDPANRYLSHSFVESPDMKNIYDGVVTTDARGFATVTMPRWFEALNRDFRYQLTVIGRSFARAIVWEELAERQFTIRTDEPRVKVSWQVTGIRHDPYADAHRIPVEEAKRGDDRGRYLHPELYGRPASEGIGG